MGTYTMNVESDGKVQQWPYHLGTDRAMAETFVYERLRHNALSVALYCDCKVVRIYDFRDLPENDKRWCHES